MRFPFSRLQPRWQVVAFLTVGSVLNYADRAALASVLPALQTDLRLSDVQLGLLGSVFLWSYALASPFAGTLADRYSRRMLALSSLVLWSVVTALTGAVGGWLGLVVLRAALGLSESLYIPAAIALAADHHGESTRGRAISLLVTGMNLGVVLGGTGAALLADHFGWRTGFWVLGLGGILFGVLYQPLLMDAPRHCNGAVRRTPRAVEGLRYLLRTPSYYLLFAKAALAGIAVWIFLTWLPLYFKEAFALGLGAAGFLGTVMLQLTAVIGTIVGGWVSDRAAAAGARRRFLMHGHGYLLATPFLLIFLLQPGPVPAVLAVALFSFFRGLGNANEQPILCEVVPPQYRATAVGLMNSCSTAIGGAAVLVAGILKSTVGLSTVFGLLSVVFALAAMSMYAGYVFFAAADIRRAGASTPASVPPPT